MDKDKLATLITEVIWGEFEAIQEYVDENDKNGLTDEIYEV